MSRHPIRQLVVLLALAGLLSACAAPLPKAQKARQLYQLEIPIAAEHSREKDRQRLPQVLELATVQAAPGYETAHILYRHTPHQQARYRDSRWSQPPARLLENALRQYLQTHGPYRHVVETATPVQKHHRLDVELLELMQHFEGEHSTVRMALDVRLLDLQTREVIASERLISEQRANGSAETAVAAANRALAELLERVRVFCLQQ